MNKTNEDLKELLSVPLKSRKAKIGDLVYLTKMKDKEILVGSNCTSRSPAKVCCQP
jgi:hypothetical protein